MNPVQLGFPLMHPVGFMLLPVFWCFPSVSSVYKCRGAFLFQKVLTSTQYPGNAHLRTWSGEWPPPFQVSPAGCMKWTYLFLGQISEFNGKNSIGNQSYRMSVCLCECVCVWCVCMCMLVCMHMCVHMNTDAILEAGNVGSINPPRSCSDCEPPDMGAENWTLVPFKSSTCSQPLSQLSSP